MAMVNELNLRPIHRSHISSLRARRHNDFQGRRVFSFPVVVQQSWLARDLHERQAVTTVIAHTQSDAARWVKDRIAHLVSRPTEISVVGPKGGRKEFFIGWFSMIGAGISNVLGNAEQLEFPINLTGAV